MNKLQKYPAYKDSGVEWLGEIPAGWEVRKLKYLLSEVNIRSTTGGEELLSLSKYYGVIPKSSLEERAGQAESLIGYKAVKPDQLVINKMQAVNGLLAVSKISGITSPDYSVYKTKYGATLSINYVGLLLSLDLYLAEFKKRVTGVMDGFIRLYTDDLFDIPVHLPPLPEQTAIAAFLDEKTAKIDTAIAQKQQMISLLKERKQILIQNAVTKGINPAATMKDSGVEWIGEIPDGWEILPFTKYVIDKSDYRGATPEKVESGIYLVTAKNIGLGRIDYQCSIEYVTEAGYRKIMQRGLPEIGDLLFTTEAPLGHFALVDREDVCFAQRIIRFRMNRSFLNPNFTLHSVISDYFQNQLTSRGTGSTALGIKASKLCQLKIICPPYSEQTAIVDFITTQSAKIDTSISLQQQQIAKLKEYKATLIDSAVTGKIKVC